MRNCSYKINELLPHAPPMVLLDQVERWDKGEVTTSLKIHEKLPFFISDDSYIPAYVGLEYMAQTCGAYAGLEALESGQSVRLGFLLGTRNYHSVVDGFRPGEKLTITAKEVLRQELMGVFDCHIFSEDKEIASAQINLYQPEDAVQILKGSRK